MNPDTLTMLLDGGLSDFLKIAILGVFRGGLPKIRPNALRDARGASAAICTRFARFLSARWESGSGKCTVSERFRVDLAISTREVRA
jgi:hypothetical protein